MAKFDEILFDGNFDLEHGDLLPVQHDVQHRILELKVHHEDKARKDLEEVVEQGEEGDEEDEEVEDAKTS